MGMGSATALKADFRNWLYMVVDPIWPATLSRHELIADAELLAKHRCATMNIEIASWSAIPASMS